MAAPPEFFEVWNKQTLRPEDLTDYIPAVGLGEGLEDMKFVKGKKVPIVITNPNTDETKQVLIEVKGFSKYGITQFDFAKAIERGWTPKEPRKDEELTLDQKKNKGWSLGLDCHKSPEVQAVQAFITDVHTRILASSEVKERLGVKRRGKEGVVDSQGWVTTNKSGDVARCNLHPKITSYFIIDSQKKTRDEVRWEDMKREEPGWYTVVISWSHDTITTIKGANCNIKMLKPLIYVQSCSWENTGEVFTREERVTTSRLYEEYTFTPLVSRPMLESEEEPEESSKGKKRKKPDALRGKKYTHVVMRKPEE